MNQAAPTDPTSSPTTGNQALRYRVKGMDCPTCAGKIENAVSRLPGVADVRVNYGSQVLDLALDEGVTPRTELEGRVERLGYGVAPLPTAADLAKARAEGVAPPAGTMEDAEPPLWRSRKALLGILIGTLFAAGFIVERIAPGLAGEYAYWPGALVGLAYYGRRAVVAATAGTPFSIEMLMSVATAGALAIHAAEEAAIVVLLFTVGEMLEVVAAGRARAGIKALAALVPKTARLVDEADGTIREVPAASLAIGQVVVVRPGDRVPADGVITDGSSSLDESPITGESVPKAKEVGDTVYAGSVNADGALQVRVTKTAADNTVARILHLVEEAQASKSPTARFIDRFSAVYTPIAFAFAAAVAVLPPLLGADWGTWVYRGLALLLIACPCALVLSTPAAIASGLAAGARRGLLVKGGAALEVIGRVRTVAFDKTGTLTAGRPRVTDILVFAPDASERSLLGLAAAVENGSSHPIARAILDRANEDGVPLRPTRDARATPGKAVQATVMGQTVLVASPRHAADSLRLGPEADRAVAGLETSGKTVVIIIRGTEALGAIAVRDEPRADAAAGIAALRKLGVRSVMLTGDNRRAAEAVASELGLDVKAELLPQDKLAEIAALKEEGPVAMVGDGINDAPALASASVGIAMGGGTDAALETADAAVLNDRVGDVAALVALSRATLGNIRQNVAIALGLKAVFLVTTIAGITGLWPAILADTGATVLVTANALRLLRA
ncbi:MAG: heavy metal translocating P-type ATPase [Methylobacteriaceae bacterium]|jgi:Cd2+/Zn2+-exporting ATPase|uniref:P-type Zn(2+) transporter n=5 Tax=Methylorubrum extorquens TaxID=408 RepID=C5B3S9_METEA|nr:heavy metal translocating P-type ATPase [Methylorubrum extorquens]AWI88006.1 cadmium-translocating P-type ATPase [Methylobacterium sp. DM1]ACK81995.1 heavy metal translocating P-type ATPase [Methylorubrum extorquens CM4]ACS43111.1 zinc, cobalt and lead efflux system [Methylorubrum extorquens AM1]EHP93487.1 heavy metal translocating P-type ATPase [Methylorubrum extorquens DSM 13060]MCG5248759.1 cadmium-translocating P-type ATPase [Methylorubrum extorquens]